MSKRPSNKGKANAKATAIAKAKTAKHAECTSNLKRKIATRDEQIKNLKEKVAPLEAHVKSLEREKKNSHKAIRSILAKDTHPMMHMK